ncbi:MAG: M48 family metallopeptidase [Bacteroidaceae bacterium]
MREGQRRILEDSELGQIIIRKHTHARRMTFRYHDSQLTCTVPPYVTIQEVANVIEEMREKLRKLVFRNKINAGSTTFTPHSSIKVDGFNFLCQRICEGKPKIKEDAQGMTFFYPDDLDWQKPALQQWLTHVVEECLRRRAKQTLIPRLEELALLRGLHPQKISIHKTKGRWGSCTASGNINLSLYLMLLPTHLRDYIMHHELTHLQEMNHGARFHALLNQAVHGHSEELGKEIKKYIPTLILQ